MQNPDNQSLSGVPEPVNTTTDDDDTNLLSRQKRRHLERMDKKYLRSLNRQRQMDAVSDYGYLELSHLTEPKLSFEGRGFVRRVMNCLNLTRTTNAQKKRNRHAGNPPRKPLVNGAKQQKGILIITHG